MLNTITAPIAIARDSESEAVATVDFATARIWLKELHTNFFILHIEKYIVLLTLLLLFKLFPF
jgi:hypothetical protein